SWLAAEKEHAVEITKGFYLGTYEVTQKQFKAVMGYNPSYFSRDGKRRASDTDFSYKPTGGKDKVKGLDTDGFPVEQVAWGDQQEFIKKLSSLPEEKKNGHQYRLPTEAEWEYACRGGATVKTTFQFGNTLSSSQANFDGNHPHPYGGGTKGKYLERTCKVGSYKPNKFGLYDMHGNVAEWCADWYDKK